VEALQACMTGAGLGEARFSLLALLGIGTAASVAGIRLFRWDARERFASRGDRGWAAVAVGAWLVVGVAAGARGEAAVHDAAGPAPLAEIPLATAPVPTVDPAGPPAETAATGPEAAGGDGAATAPPAVGAGRDAQSPPAPPGPAPVPPGPWQRVTRADVDRLHFAGLPPDDGLVTPIAPASARPHPAVARELACVRDSLREWEPGAVADPVQRVRNLLYVAAVPDKFQMERLESWLPLLVLEQLRQGFREDQLVQILYWVAAHPAEGSVAAATQLRGACIDTGGRPLDVPLLRERTAIYATKLLGRITGRIAPG
jgi:hypothetical protein